MDIWDFPGHNRALHRSSTVAGEEPQIITWSTSISSVDLEIVNYFKLQNTWTQSHYSLRIANPITLVCILLELFLQTHTPVSLPLYNFVSFSFHKQYSVFPLIIRLGKLPIAKSIAVFLLFNQQGASVSMWLVLCSGHTGYFTSTSARSFWGGNRNRNRISGKASILKGRP